MGKTFPNKRDLKVDCILKSEINYWVEILFVKIQDNSLIEFLSLFDAIANCKSRKDENENTPMRAWSTFQ